MISPETRSDLFIYSRVLSRKSQAQSCSCRAEGSGARQYGVGGCAEAPSLLQIVRRHLCPGGHRGYAVGVDEEDHVPAGWGQVRVAGHGYLDGGRRLAGDREVDQSLLAVEGVGGDAVADEGDPRIVGAWGVSMVTCLAVGGLGRVPR